MTLAKTALQMSWANYGLSLLRRERAYLSALLLPGFAHPVLQRCAAGGFGLSARLV